jgi:hypothetical protein
MLLTSMSRAPRSPTSLLFSALGTTLLFRPQLIQLTVVLRLGVTPISTLSEWTDVLHLSTKWGFEHLRTAAIMAILPLASAVDKLVLGRTYGFVDWVPGAYTDLLKREDDLTLDEAKKMALEDVVALAKGRREARTQRIKPDAAIDQIVQSLLPIAAPQVLASGPTSEDAVPPAVSAPVVDVIPPQLSRADPISADDQARISRWLDQMNNASSRAVPQECLVKFIQEDRARVPLVLDMVLECGFKEINKTIESQGTLRHRLDSRLWDATADGSRHDDLTKMHSRDTTLGLINSKQTEDACLRLVDYWRALTDLDLTTGADDLIATPAWKSMTRATTYLAYLHDASYVYECGWTLQISIVCSPVFSAFWITLANLYRSTSCKHQVVLARCTKTLLAEFGQYTSKLAVCNEMDGFYQAVEEMRTAAQAQALDEHRELLPLLNVSIGVFPSPAKLTTAIARTSSDPGSGPRNDQGGHSSWRICFIRSLCLLYIPRRSTGN